jgi:conjugal transfer pilin signal peptidase TrbI
MSAQHTDLTANLVQPSLAQRWAMLKAERFPLARKRLPWTVVAGLAILVGSQHVALGWVWTESVPAHVVLILKGTPPRPGELMAYAYEGAEIAGWRHGDAFVKFAAAMEGDRVQREGRHFWAETRRGRVDLGLAKTISRKGLPLEAAQGGVIPPGFIYAYAPQIDALDSRYAAAGLVRREAVIGRAVVLF